MSARESSISWETARTGSFPIGEAAGFSAADGGVASASLKIASPDVAADVAAAMGASKAF
jgi:hypothetical protein